MQRLDQLPPASRIMKRPNSPRIVAGARVDKITQSAIVSIPKSARKLIRCRLIEKY